MESICKQNQFGHFILTEKKRCWNDFLRDYTHYKNVMRGNLQWLFSFWFVSTLKWILDGVNQSLSTRNTFFLFPPFIDFWSIVLQNVGVNSMMKEKCKPYNINNWITVRDALRFVWNQITRTLRYCFDFYTEALVRQVR